MFYRIQQFIRAITAKVTKEDQNWVQDCLSEEEWQLFAKLRTYDQCHSIEVARQLEKAYAKSHQMVRLGLLHDIGKSVYPLNPFEKGIMVILDKATRGKVAKYCHLKSVQGYYNHPKYGYDLLRALGNEEETFLRAVREHHQKEVGDPLTRILQEMDNQC